MTVRDARETDLPAIVGIYNAAMPGGTAVPDTTQVPIDSRVAWFRGHDAARHPLWVVDADGSAAAWLSVQPFRERAGYRGTAEVSVYVAPDLQREGLGRRVDGGAP